MAKLKLVTFGICYLTMEAELRTVGNPRVIQSSNRPPGSLKNGRAEKALILADYGAVGIHLEAGRVSETQNSIQIGAGRNQEGKTLSLALTSLASHCGRFNCQLQTKAPRKRRGTKSLHHEFVMGVALYAVG